jgi:DNA topoisomerase-1
VPSIRLQYITDTTPGITRRRCGRGFSYRLPNGQPLKRKAELERIRALAIPPAYQQVWICPQPEGYLQATGRDAAHRKQYRYHDQYRAWRQRLKYDRLVDFGDALAALRRQVNRDLQGSGLSRTRVLAAAVRLMDLTLIRAGHGGETGGKPTYGLATLREKHLDLDGDGLQLAFRGKSGQVQRRQIDAPAVSKVLRRCQGLPGRELFVYEDEDGRSRRIDAGDVNDYLAEYAGPEVSAKDFRTWGGTVLAACRLASVERGDTKPQRHRQTVTVVKHVASSLGNRPATARKYYIHPEVFDAFEKDRLAEAFADCRRLDARPARTQLSRVEEAVLTLLRNA